MKSFLLIGSLFAMTLISCYQNNDAISDTDSETTITKDYSEIKNLIRKYAESINNADSAIGFRLFAHTSEVSFIHPRGHEMGWSQINNSIYKFFDKTFSSRDLKIFNDNVTVYNNTAWVEFYWIFDATFKSDNAPLQTKGRETQIWRKLNGQWQIVHIHYSVMPITTIPTNISDL